MFQPHLEDTKSISFSMSKLSGLHLICMLLLQGELNHENTIQKIKNRFLGPHILQI